MFTQSPWTKHLKTDLTAEPNHTHIHMQSNGWCVQLVTHQDPKENSHSLFHLQYHSIAVSLNWTDIMLAQLLHNCCFSLCIVQTLFYKSTERQHLGKTMQKEKRESVCQGNGVRGQRLMTHFVDVEACWHEVQPGTGTAREREKWMQPATHTYTHRETVTHTHVRDTTRSAHALTDERLQRTRYKRSLWDSLANTPQTLPCEELPWMSDFSKSGNCGDLRYFCCQWMKQNCVSEN